MAADDMQADTPDAAGIVIPANLMPINAAAAHEAALAVMKGAAGDLLISLDGDEPSACAMQILVAAQRSADAKALRVTLCDGAKTVLADLN